MARSREWYQSRLGYQVQIEFVEQGRLMGYGLAHPNGGPMLGLRLDPQRARAAAGFDYFAIAVPSKDAIDQLAARLTSLGERHAGVHWATIGWILPELHDPAYLAGRDRVDAVTRWGELQPAYLDLAANVS
jgi:hypothetical protein